MRNTLELEDPSLDASMLKLKSYAESVRILTKGLGLGFQS